MILKNSPLKSFQKSDDGDVAGCTCMFHGGIILSE